MMDRPRRRPNTTTTTAFTRSLLSSTLLTTTLLSSTHAIDTQLRGKTTMTSDVIAHLMGLPSTSSSSTTAHPSATHVATPLNPPQPPTNLLETESLVHLLHRKLGGIGTSGSSSKKEDKPAIDPAAIAMAQTVQASMAYGQPIAHPVNSAWNPLNQDHTPQAATNQVVQLPYDPLSNNQQQDLSENLGGYSAFPQGTAPGESLVELNAATHANPLVVETVPMKSPDEYASQVLAAPRGQPVANPSIMAGTSVVQHPALSNIKEGLQANPFGAVMPDASSFATNPLAYHPSAQVSHPSMVGAAAVAQTSSPPIAFGNYAGGNVVYNPKVATTIGAQRAHQYLLRSAYAPRQGEAAPFPAVPWHAGAAVMNSNGSPTFKPQPLNGAWVSGSGAPANTGLGITNTGLVEESSAVAVQQGVTPPSSNTPPPAFDGNYLKQWPPPSGTPPGMVAMMGVHPGVTPAVPPPAPPPIGMAPPPPPASHVMDTPDVLPQPTPPTAATDARWGVKGFPTQNDAGLATVPSTEARRSQETPSEPLLNEPLMVPFGRENTIHGGSP